MRYWCSKCGSEFSPAKKVFANLFIDDEIECPFCETRNVCKLPDFETPEQYKKRTGKEWNGATFVHCNYIECDSDCEYKGWGVKEEYGCLSRPTILCANSPEPPPDDFVPEGV